MMGHLVPSPFGHALAGLAIHWSADPLPAPDSLVSPAVGAPELALRESGRRECRADSWSLAILLATLAMLPDLDLVHSAWHRKATHSLGATILVTIVAMVVTGWVTRRINWWLALLCGAAYGSHILMDWLGADNYPPIGIQALWPFSDGWFIAPWTIFPLTERRNLLSAATWLINLKAAGAEAGVMGSIASVSWIRRRGRIRGPICVRDAPPPPSDGAADRAGTSDPRSPRAGR